MISEKNNGQYTNDESKKIQIVYVNKKQYDNFKKISIIISLIFMITIVIKMVIPIIFILFMEVHTNIYGIPQGELIEEVVSPTAEYTLQSYFISNNIENTLENNAMSVVVLNNKTREARNIYYNSPENKLVIKWLDEENVQINDKKLNIYEDKYNYKIQTIVNILEIIAMMSTIFIAIFLIVKYMIRKKNKIKYNLKKEKKHSLYTYLKSINLIDKVIEIFLCLIKGLVIIFCITYLIFIFYLIIFENIFDSEIPNGGMQVEELISPSEEYTLKSYCLEGDYLSADAMRVEIYNNKTKETKNIYYNYPENEVKMKWIDEENVQINDIKLNIYKDAYDWRKER